MDRPIRSLLFSTLYPSAARPVHGIFVETRLRELLASQPVQARVLAPVPWFPSTSPRFGDYARMARTPAQETRHGIEVLHPRYPLIPKLGMSVAPALLAAACVAPLQRLLRQGFDFDLIDAHYFYPDGVAAALLARWFGRPLVITARGSDVNLIAGHALPRRWMLWAARQAAAVVGVSAALVEAMRALGMDGDKLHVVRNGVDLERFQPWPRDQVRAELGLQGAPVLLSVGNLLANKGHHLVIEALARLLPQHPAARLCIVGEGPERDALQALAARLGLAAHVTLTGALPNEQLARWYSAADVLVLASGREGWPNVLLEAMACGTPVLATAVGGVPEIVSGAAGRVLAARDAAAIAQALGEQLAALPPRSVVRQHAAQFGWGASSLAQLQIFQRSTQAVAQACHA